MHVHDDLFVLPDDGKWFIWLDHDGLLILCFRDHATMSQMAESWSEIWNPAGAT